MNYITILDFEHGKVFKYDVEDGLEYDEYETYITTLNHNLDNCEWMVHD